MALSYPASCFADIDGILYVFMQISHLKIAAFNCIHADLKRGPTSQNSAENISNPWYGAPYLKHMKPID